MMRVLLVGLVMPTATIAIFHVSPPVPLFESAVARPSGVASLKRGVELERRGARILEADNNNNIEDGSVGSWACEHCSFVNTRPNAKRCSMCRCSRSPAAASKKRKLQ